MRLEEMFAAQDWLLLARSGDAGKIIIKGDLTLPDVWPIWGYVHEESDETSMQELRIEVTAKSVYFSRVTEWTFEASVVADWRVVKRTCLVRLPDGRLEHADEETAGVAS